MWYRSLTRSRGATKPAPQGYFLWGALAIRQLFLLCAVFTLPAWADGVNVAKPSSMRNLVPAGALEQQATTEYAHLKQAASAKGALAPDGHSQLRRLRTIAGRMIPLADRFNPRARQWQWEVNLIGLKQVNAFCMSGGKIAVYTGILDTLKLTDDGVGIVLGHEVAHARMAKNQRTRLGAGLLDELLGGGKYAGAFLFGGDLLSLTFSRDDETDADVVGLDLAACAEFDPRAGVML